MNKILSIIAIGTLLFVSQGCTDWLDVRPESEVVLEDFWQNEAHVNQVVASSYRLFTEEGAIRRMMVWGEVRSDNVVESLALIDDENMYKAMNLSIDPGNGYATWGSMYIIINNCNSFLHYAPDVVDLDENFTESKLRSLTAEILTLRSLAYFYLVRTFKEVPWIEDPSIDDTQDYNKPKVSETFILNQIEKDLLYAERYARDEFDTQEYSKGRITRSAVRALLADVYLWQNEYQKSISMADKVLNDSRLELVDGEDVLQEVFYQGNSTESIFELQFDTDNRPNDAVVDFYGDYDFQMGAWAFPDILVSGKADRRVFSHTPSSNSVESAEDLRRFDFLRRISDRYAVFKYSGRIRTENAEGLSSYFYRSNTPNWIIYRLSDVMLMKAEALVQLNRGNQDFQEALDLVNKVYLRSNPELESGLSLSDYPTKRSMQELVLRERQRELMFEGKRWFDLMRVARRDGNTDDLISKVTRKFGGGGGEMSSKLGVMNALYFPIHNSELDANSALEQNPFYKVTEDGSTIE